MGGSRGAKVDPQDYEPGEREKALAAIAVDANNINEHIYVRLPRIATSDVKRAR